MIMSDIAIKLPEGLFSYRVAGICIRDGKILLQKPTNKVDYSLPGGHVAFSEQNAIALAREFREELDVTATVGDLKWVAENFFRWNMRPCHQICLYYEVSLPETACTAPVTVAKNYWEGQQFKLEFHWIPLKKLREISVHPVDIADLLEKWDDGIQYRIYRD